MNGLTYLMILLNAVNIWIGILLFHQSISSFISNSDSNHRALLTAEGIPLFSMFDASSASSEDYQGGALPSTELKKTGKHGS